MLSSVGMQVDGGRVVQREPWRYESPIQLARIAVRRLVLRMNSVP